MKKTYTRKQITEAISYWKKQLSNLAESTILENDVGVTYEFIDGFSAEDGIDLLTACSDNADAIKDLMVQIDSHEQSMNNFSMILANRNEMQDFKCKCAAIAKRQDGRVVGICIGQDGWEFIPNCIDVDYMVVSDEYRGKSLGNEMLDFFCDKCNASGYDHIILHVNCKNPRAEHVYRKNGFKPFMLMMMRSDDI